jgi:hypothetical protein
MLILIAERLHHSPATEYSRVLEFIGARSGRTSSIAFRNFIDCGSNFTFLPEDDNVGDYRIPEMNENTKQKLREIYASHNQRLFQYLGVDSIPEWEDNYVAPALPKEPVVTSVRRESKITSNINLCDMILSSPTNQPGCGNHFFLLHSHPNLWPRDDGLFGRSNWD